MASHNRLSGPVVFLGGFVLVVVLIAGAIVLWPKTDYTYHGFPIEKGACPGTEVTCWFATIRLREVDYIMSFYHHPTEVEQIPVSAGAVKTVYNLQQMAGSSVIIAVPKNAPGAIGVAATEVSRVLGQRYNLFNFPVSAGLSGASAQDISCLNASASTMVVLFRQQEIAAVTLDAPNCIAIGAVNEDEATAVADAFVYRLLGVIPYPTNSTVSTAIATP